MREFLHDLVNELSGLPGIWVPAATGLLVGLIALWLALLRRSSRLCRQLALSAVAIAVVSTATTYYFKGDDYKLPAFAILASPSIPGIVVFALGRQKVRRGFEVASAAGGPTSGYPALQRTGRAERSF